MALNSGSCFREVSDGLDLRAELSPGFEDAKPQLLNSQCSDLEL